MSRLPLSSKPIRLLIIIALVLVVSLPIIHPFQVATAQNANENQYYNTEFAWNYGGNHWTWNLSIPVGLYDAYTEVSDSVRTQISLAHFGFFTTTQDNLIQTLAYDLNNSATQLGYNSDDKVNFILAFVQSIPYKTDNASTGYQDYPRFPIETLVDNVGDCKSHSILFATLTLIMGYGTVYINPPDHLAVGVLGNNLQGAYFTYNNNTYYYAETTGTGFTLGELPDQFKGQSAYVYGIDVNQQYTVNLQSTSTGQSNPTNQPYTGDTPTPSPKGENIPTVSPDISQPTIQPAQPISINLISDNPTLFIIIAVAIGTSIAVTIKTAKNPKETKPNKQTVPTNSNISLYEDPNAQEKLLNNAYTIVEKNKFCIFCGSSNKSFALYCEKCGKRIA